MLQISPQTQDKVITLLIKAIHPSFTHEQVNSVIREVQNLKPIKKETPNDGRSKNKS